MAQLAACNASILQIHNETLVGVMRIPPFPWLKQAYRAGVVLDSGVLLLHAFGHYQNGRYLSEVSAGVPSDDISKVAKIIAELLKSVPSSCITPQVLAEFQALARIRARLNDEELALFLKQYSEFPIQEIYVQYRDLTSIKTKVGAWNISYTDTSVALAGVQRGAPVLTLDRALRRLAQPLKVQILHVYEDFYLHLAD